MTVYLVIILILLLLLTSVQPVPHHVKLALVLELEDVLHVKMVIILTLLLLLISVQPVPPDAQYVPAPLLAPLAPMNIH